MKIGIDASRANELKKTGTEWYAYQLIQEFKKIADPNDQFILYTKEPLREDLSVLPPNFRNRVLRWPPQYLWTQIRLSWEMIFRKPDLLFVPAHTIPLIHPKKTVTTLHDVGFERFHELYSKARIGYRPSLTKVLINALIKLLTLGKYGNNEYDYHRFSARFALKHAKKIITVSNFTKKEILDIYGKRGSGKIKVIPNAYNKAEIKQKFTASRTSETLKKYKIESPFLLYIGRLEEKKNITGLIEAFKILITKYNFKGQLVLLGKQGFNFEKTLRVIERYGLDKYVIRPGWVNEEERIILLKSAVVFVFPSFYEGFGIPPLEAMASGVPVVAANSASIPEVTGNAALLVDPHDFKAMAEGINRIMDDPKLRDDFIAAGYRRAEKYSWKSTAEQTLQELKNV
ncbi:MAG: hypothetical protein COY66_06620 [Candidatus Kerfeldbacteria bacterium CG_4_10_14_0_8_um_filter_42_10]|uniref:Glycosyltransferase family 1 protein n=1 Tax=Candidatus Kerfeldbacteria bacterium CG_4_10_14_0_8_um_filter_42_10 TaxID=2014248 RepID=A0A2M7RFJ5_9BACT|nr:MAG: hypothetical protein COY66_06620 [Candidatus Kerfeldbacteria bacterium CG_4_10_14_0_8_um_filter_42_10]